MRSRQSKIENREKGLIDKVEITTGFLELLCNFFLFSQAAPVKRARVFAAAAADDDERRNSESPFYIVPVVP
jgi:hypothetical protein|tara:strand:- start:618 stop:833 length:216 start_codon:yes stop_codon:yes gene_type:complete